MSKAAIAGLLLSSFFLAAGAKADAWTDGQAAWAKHGFHHGAWDCNGQCPEGRKSASREHVIQHRPTRDAVEERSGGYDGAWSVSSGGYCASAGVSQVLIQGHRISGQSLVGTVSQGGAVHTVGSFNGMSIIGNGHIAGNSASGSYRQSDGCSGNWSAYKL